MKALFIGGTGVISTSVSRLAVKNGWELYLLNRGQKEVTIPGSYHFVADIYDVNNILSVLRNHMFNVVVDWIAFTPSDIERDITLFRNITEQYIFISSASVYQKPPVYPIITESTPLINPYWDYAQNKIACEEHLVQAYRQSGFPITIVRPSLTYSTLFPIAIGGWGCYTLADRLLRGDPIIVHGDGSSLWTVTYAEDFALGFLGIMGNPYAIGHAFHITSDEVLTWNQIYTTIADALGVEAKIIHIPSDFIAKINPSLGASLLGDKTWSAIFDNSKIKSFVPGYQAIIPFREGIRRTLAWFDEDLKRKFINQSINKEMDQIIAHYEKR